MIKWNEKKEQMQKADLKTTVIKLASLETYTAKNGQDVVVIKGEQPFEKFTNFMRIWKNQGISLDSLNYGDELLIRWVPNQTSQGVLYKNFKEVYQKKRTTLHDLDHWDPKLEVPEDVDMREWETE